MPKVDLVDLQKDVAHVSQDHGNKFVVFQVTSGVSLELGALSNLRMKRQEVPVEDCFESISSLVLRIEMFTDLNDGMEEDFEAHVRLVGVCLTVEQVDSLLVG